ncbi:hypothetical protein [Pseudorhodobacter sp.]|uniref:hypothetical protein n=1 Tax=Pseudorhodobacter sp. TaxID=1934400 RepID=UPI0026476075|nr:hypothetical protein [Pseudorhodobacter sp.]MDN5788652.1 hypothetical protein [Pseudorhodobacter sp.]
MKSISIPTIALISAMHIATPIQAYPIDCAILLCLAGGFPPSVECSAAKAEFIRRITPWPIEPPLQLWRCPMGLNPQVGSLVGAVNFGPDGLTPDIRRYRDAIEIYHVIAFGIEREGRDNEHTVDVAEFGSYDIAGHFYWQRSSFGSGPAWLHEIAGGVEPSYRKIRGVGLRFQDHEGKLYDKWVSY